MWLLLFDVDGTLLQVRRQPVRAALREALGTVLRRSVPQEWLEDLAGKTDWQIFADTATLCGWSKEAIQEHRRLFFRTYVRAHAHWVHPSDVDVLPGVRELLSHLVTLPVVTVGVLTGNLQPIAAWKLRCAGIAPFFRVGAFGSDHWERARLVPIVWQRARMQGLPVRPERTVLVGDSPRDVLCAHAWGIPCVAVCTGPFDASALHAAGATVVLPTLQDSVTFLRVLYELQARTDHRY